MMKKDNSPSPTSYKVAEAIEKTSGKGSLDRGGRYYQIGKSKRNSYIEQIETRSKKLPGVGKYDSHTALDKVFRPMKRR
jgi:hypothetical protein|tara:strand:- start:74 stop:310 length:237 start_codon:yes stop_codon:yes gene_type:complete